MNHAENNTASLPRAGERPEARAFSWAHFDPVYVTNPSSIDKACRRERHKRWHDKRTANAVFKYLTRLLLLKTFIFSFTLSLANASPTFSEIKSQWRSSEATLLDRNGQPIHELRIDNKVRRLQWTALDDISPSLKQTVIQTEDQRFYSHKGVDWHAIAAALWNKAKAHGRRGGSTITMQLAAMLDPQLSSKRGTRSLSQKWKQMRAAMDLETTWSKAEILEAYLNMVTFRGEVQGISASAKLLFDKAPSGLNDDESLILTTLISSPNAQPLVVSSRACLLRRLDSSGCESVRRLTLQALEQRPTSIAVITLAPHLARQLLATAGEKVTSTIDSSVQTFANNALQAQLMSLSKDNVRDGAVLVMDNVTGDVLAYVGNGGKESSARYVDGVRALRQAGSTLKPFLYELAIEDRLLTAASILDDSPVNLVTPVGLYVPQNYDKEFKGAVSVRTALASSLNIPAVRTLILTGTDDFYSRLKSLGYTSLTESAEFYGYSLALGSAEVSLLEQVNAYRALANSGQWTQPRFRLQDHNDNPKSIMRPDAAFIVADILSDRGARSLTFGLDNVLATSYWTAVKTGTSKDMRDNWCIGFSERYTVGVWVGNFDGESMHNVSGVTGAAPLWREVMDYLHRSHFPSSPTRPAGVVSQRVTFAGKVEPARTEWFLNDTGMSTVTPSTASYASPHITYPGNGTIIALDPDIPVGQQTVFFEAKPKIEKFIWKLNNQTPMSGHYAKWTPRLGKYRLQLLNDRKQVIDEVEFQVR